VWELESGELLERRELDTWVDKAQVRPYCLKSAPGSDWEKVVDNLSKKEMYLCWLRAEDVVDKCLVGGRKVFLCWDGQVLILDISRRGWTSSVI
jgi:hypothetical protein